MHYKQKLLLFLAQNTALDKLSYELTKLNDRSHISLNPSQTLDTGINL